MEVRCGKKGVIVCVVFLWISHTSSNQGTYINNNNPPQTNEFLRSLLDARGDLEWIQSAERSLRSGNALPPAGSSGRQPGADRRRGGPRDRPDDDYEDDRMKRYVENVNSRFFDYDSENYGSPEEPRAQRTLRERGTVKNFNESTLNNQTTKSFNMHALNNTEETVYKMKHRNLPETKNAGDKNKHNKHNFKEYVKNMTPYEYIDYLKKLYSKPNMRKVRKPLKTHHKNKQNNHSHHKRHTMSSNKTDQEMKSQKEAKKLMEVDKNFNERNTAETAAPLPFKTNRNEDKHLIDTDDEMNKTRTIPQPEVRSLTNYVARRDLKDYFKIGHEEDYLDYDAKEPNEKNIKRRDTDDNCDCDDATEKESTTQEINKLNADKERKLSEIEAHEKGVKKILENEEKDIKNNNSKDPVSITPMEPCEGECIEMQKTTRASLSQEENTPTTKPVETTDNYHKQTQNQPTHEHDEHHQETLNSKKAHAEDETKETTIRTVIEFVVKHRNKTHPHYKVYNYPRLSHANPRRKQWKRLPALVRSKRVERNPETDLKHMFRSANRIGQQNADVQPNESAGPELEDAILGKLANDLVAKVHEQIQQMSNLKNTIATGLAKLSRPSDTEKNIAKYLERTRQHGAHKSDEVLHEVAGLINEIVRDRVTARSCMTLAPTLVKYLRDATAASAPKPQRDEDNDDLNQDTFLFRDGQKTVTEKTLRNKQQIVEKLVDQYERLPEEERHKYRVVGKFLSRKLNSIHQLIRQLKDADVRKDSFDIQRFFDAFLKNDRPSKKRQYRAPNVYSKESPPPERSDSGEAPDKDEQETDLKFRFDSDDK